ncbi:DNA polymerase Y family protein [Trueperella bialowiezensis]|uniref:DNA polymerase IV n=1 Tax=Trueperella bialowiezensis TaxID=312285 RepID=A0A3S5EVX2_9ACTO|nr:DNA polymerase Y family protein [Trueperella bialowiezensis]VEI12362.1 DNA polymerase IV [Trueperella bialowiezensis]
MRGVVWIPDWPVVTALLTGQARPEDPIAVVSQRIIAVNGIAQRAGVRVGMKRREAQSILPGLTCVRHNPEQDAAQFERVVRACEEHVAYVSVLEPGTITFFARGPAKSAGGIAALSEQLIGSIASATGVEAHVGFGQGLLTAVLAARQDAHIHNMRPFLDAHPIDSLAAAAFTSQAKARVAAFINAMKTLGIQCIGDLRALDRSALAARFGAVATHVMELLDGGDLDGVGVTYPIRELVVERSVDPPLNNADQAAFLARQMAHELSHDLASRGVVAQEIVIAVRTEEGHVRERLWSVAVASPRDITDRVRWQLGAWLAEADSDGGGLGSGIAHIAVTARQIAAAGLAQGTLWGGDRRGDAQAQRAVSRIQALLGDQAVVVPQRVGGRHPLESHKKRLWDAAPTQEPRVQAPFPGRLPEPWPHVVKAQPDKIRVVDSQGHECLLSSLGTFYCGDRCVDPRPAQLISRHSAAVVADYAGPWLQAVGWWNPHTQQRKAWMEVVDDARRGYLIFRENNQWWLAGVYE